MAIKWIGAAWRANLETYTAAERFYLDFRQKVYPPLAGHDLEFDLHTSGDNKPGSHYLSGGNAYYALNMPATFILSVEVYPNFAFDVGANQRICGWFIDGAALWLFYYDEATDKFTLAFGDGGNLRYLTSRQFDDGSNHEDIDQWMRWDIIFDSTTGDTTGSKLYYNRNLEDDAWDDSIDAKTNIFPLFEIRALNGTEGDYKINFVRLFPGVVTDDVVNDHKARQEEEIYWSLNGHGAGQTRCNIGRLVRKYFINQKLGGANSCMLELYSTEGEFADEQYAVYQPTSESFNGLSTQAYLQYRCPMIVESWYANAFEPIFVGRVDEDYFQRHSPGGGETIVTVTAEDAVADCGQKMIEHAISYEDFDLCDPTNEAASLLHVITRLALQKSVTNYLANSSFENATIGDSWLESGGTLTKDADFLLGSACAKLDADDASAETLQQTVLFTRTKKLNVGDTYNLAIYLKSAGAATANIEIEEHDVGGYNDQSVQAYTLAGGEGWYKWEVSHQITDEDSDRLIVVIHVADGEIIFADCAMLVQADTAYDWIVLNNNDGASAVAAADDADSATYETIGYDTDAAAITHPWALVKEGSNVWRQVKNLAIATIARYYGVDSSGAFVFKPGIDEPADPSPILTLPTVMTELDSQLQLQQANRIIVHGIKIVEDTHTQLVWSAKASRLFGDDADLVIEIVNGEIWPDPDEYGELWAKYDDSLQSAAAAVPTPATHTAFGALAGV